MLFAAFCLLSAGLTGWIVSRTLLSGAEFRFRLIAGIVAAESALAVSFQAAAALQLIGLTERLAPWHAAAVLTTILALAALLWGRRAVAEAIVESDEPEPIPIYLWVSGLAIGGAYLVGAACGFDGYIIDYDAVSYHLLLPQRWLIDGTLAISAKTNWRFGMPANGEAAMYWFYAGGLSRWAFLAQWPAVACLLASAYSLALGLSRNRVAAWSSTVLAATLPIVYYQTFNGYVDVFAVAFLAAALALAQAAILDRKEAGTWYWLVGLACGIAVGAKLTYLAFVCPLAVALAVFSTAKLRTAGALLGGIALPSAFWFLRSWLMTGNPVYPMLVSIGDWVIFPGMESRFINGVNWALGRWVRSRSEWLVYPWLEYRARPSITSYSVDSGMGAGFATFVPLGLAYFCWSSWRRRGDKERWVWLTGLVYCGLIWWFPLHQTLRFGLILFVLMVIASAPLFAFLTTRRNRIFGVVFCTAVTLTSWIVLLEPAAFIASRHIYNMRTRAAIYRYPTYVDSLPAGSTVMNLATPNNFAMAGEKLSNRVVGFFEVPRDLTTDFLREQRVDYIVGHQRHAERLEGLRGVRLIHSETYHDPVGGGDQPWRIWKVDRTGGSAPSGDEL